LNTTNVDVVPNIKEGRARENIYLFEKYELTFKKDQLSKITDNWNDGLSIDDLVKIHERHPIEILLALIYQANKNKIKRPFAYKLENKGGNGSENLRQGLQAKEL